MSDYRPNRDHNRRGKVVGESVAQLIQSAEWVLQFLEQYPPYFSDGRSMETDLGGGLLELQKAVDNVKEIP